MSTLDWLDENEHRNYPFTVDAQDGLWLAGLVDADFVLGQDILFDLNQDDAMVLTSITLSGAGTAEQNSSTWTFRHWRDGVVVSGSPALTVQVPANPSRHSVWTGSTPGGSSRARLVLGDPARVVGTGAVVCPLEDRVVRTDYAGETSRVRVYNTVRPYSYRPYFTANPAKSAAQSYLDAVQASPHAGGSTSKLVTSGGVPFVGATSFRGGSNAIVTSDSSSRQISIALQPGAGSGRDCSMPPESQGYAGTLRGLNGQAGSRGDLYLVAGAGFEITTDQSNYRVTIKTKALADTQGCGQAVEQLEPQAIPGPP